VPDIRVGQGGSQIELSSRGPSCRNRQNGSAISRKIIHSLPFF